MPRKYRRRYKKDDELDRLITGFLVLYIFALLGLRFTDKERFWRWIIYGLIVFILIIAGIVLYKKLREKFRTKKIERLTASIRKAGLEEYINNFISNYGLGSQEKKQISWNYRDYSIAWYRIDDLRKFLKEKNILFSNNDICLLLKEYIEEREYKKMIEGSEASSHRFKDLRWDDFEKLLYRLYEKMGYAVQFTGKRGDQGSDLVITKKGKRIVVQAKCYQGLVNNKAIQEAVAAKGLYNCDGATVVTTSDFRGGALELAKANNVYLINGKKLRELLLDYLKENWI